MKWFTQLSILLSLVILFSSCGSNNSKSEVNQIEEPAELADEPEMNDTQYFRVLSPTTCTQENKNRFIYQVMHDSYLWADSVPELDYTDITQYSDSHKLLDALKSSNDRFSFLIDEDEWRSYEEGKSDNDFGFRGYLIEREESRLYLVISFVNPNSSADKAGIKRGDVITHLNGKEMTKSNRDELFELFEQEKSIDFTILQKEKSSIIKTLVKTSYEIDPVLYSTHFEDIAGKRVGYMVFNDFVDTAIGRIDKLFDEYYKLGIDEFILDLRYNGGGSEVIANHLASLIGGVNVENNIFHKVFLNERYSMYNEVQYFESNNRNALNLNRVFVLTSEESCSASELIINALKASANNIEVIQIGKTTCGKPYGFAGYGKVCDEALLVLNMETKNSDDVGGYIDGLTPTCVAEDNPFSSFGDKEESLLKEALYYIEKDSCSKESVSKQKQYKRSKIGEMIPRKKIR